MIDKCAKLIKEEGKDVDIHKLIFDDKKTYELLTRGEVFWCLPI
ncbi:MAG UNVERIFIED_CONTAM: hypothetical protein LVQ98_01615 [Rickettsiaceae bacterium]